MLYQADSSHLQEAIVAIAKIEATGNEKKYLAEKSYNYVIDFPDKFYSSFFYGNSLPYHMLIIEKWSDNIAFEITSHFLPEENDLLQQFEYLSFEDYGYVGTHYEFNRKVVRKTYLNDRIISRILILFSGLFALFFAVRNKNKKHIYLILAIMISWFGFQLGFTSIIRISGLFLFLATGIFSAVLVVKTSASVNVRSINLLIIVFVLLPILYRMMHWPGAGFMYLLGAIFSLVWLVVTIWNFKLIARDFNFIFIYWIFCICNFWSLASSWF